MTTLEERARDAGTRTTPQTAMRDFDRFVAKELARQRWETRPFWTRWIDKLRGRKGPQ